MPERIQLSRAKGWRMPPGTVKVDRATPWGNPFKPTTVSQTGMGGTARGMEMGASGAVKAYRALMQEYGTKYPTAQAEWLAPLRGKNLACWCPIGSPCHADVLLELANKEVVHG